MHASETAARPDCPPWCGDRHGELAGEDDWVHTGMVTWIGANLVARLCTTVDPRTGAADGPYVLLNDIEITLEQARTLSRALREMTDAAHGGVVPAQSELG